MSDVLSCHTCGKKGTLIGHLLSGGIQYFCAPCWEQESERLHLFQLNQE